MCGQIQAAICALPVDGGGNPYGVVDAREFSGTQACGSNPFASPTDSSGKTLFANGNITLLLGPVTIQTTATWFLPQQTLVRGSAGSVVTKLQASTGAGTVFTGLGTNNCVASSNGGSTFCVPVVCFGVPVNDTGVGGPALDCDTPATQSGNNTPRIQMEYMNIDGNSIAGSALVANVTGEEKSFLHNVQFTFFKVVALSLGPTGPLNPPTGLSQNSGSYTDLEIIGPAGSCTPGTPEYGIFAGNSIQTAFGSGGHITFTGSCTSPGSNVIAMDINGPGVTVQNVHCEKWYDCLLAGDKVVTSITASNLTGSDGVQNTVHINGNNHVNGLLTNIYQNTTANNVIFDQQSSVTIPAGGSGTTVPSYVAGTGADTAYSESSFTAGAVGAVSAPGLIVAGAPFSGGGPTTTLPQTYLNAGAAPSFSTNGTMLGENAPSGFVGNLLDFHVNGVASVAMLDYRGIFTKYNSQSTVDLGVPSILGTLDQTNVSTANSGTPQSVLTSTPVAGHYRLFYYVDQHAGCSILGSPAFTITAGWTDATHARASAATSFTPALTASGTSLFTQNTIDFWTASGTAVTVTATYSPCSTGTWTYDLHAYVEEIE